MTQSKLPESTCANSTTGGLVGVPSLLKELIDEMAGLCDVSLRQEILIEYGNSFKDVPESIARRPYPEINKIPACESDAYVFPVTRNDGRIDFYYAVENPQGISAKALATILSTTLSGQPLSEVANITEEVAYAIFGRDLSMGKGLGLSAMVRVTRDIAKEFILSSQG
ncbi:MAG TPA: SufE family protein [Oligoflexia bacterium]|nr:SufE family protein [Oligoflexia bacterium]HMP49005.1 SufE family protein [Oligoflexia bacterium]